MRDREGVRGRARVARQLLQSGELVAIHALKDIRERAFGGRHRFDSIRGSETVAVGWGMKKPGAWPGFSFGRCRYAQVFSCLCHSPSNCKFSLCISRSNSLMVLMAAIKSASPVFASR